MFGATRLHSQNPDSRTPARPKLLILEFWGLGDLTLSTTILPAALAQYDVTIAAKPAAPLLLGPSYPEVQFLAFDPPWTVFRGKYLLWRWPWTALNRHVRALRRERFDAAVSVRNDPRDHLLMRLSGAPRRIGFPRKGSEALLTSPLRRPTAETHKVEDWRQIGSALGLPGMSSAAPSLDPAAYDRGSVERLLPTGGKPLVVLHPGARIAVRRWPEAYFLEIIRRLRREFTFELAVIVEPDGYGQMLAPEAQTMISSLNLGELVSVLARADLVLCNDSGPAHIAAACGTPTCTVFGPGDNVSFRPWGDIHFIAVADLCTYRPCFDYCRFPEPFCLTRLLPDTIWAGLRTHLLALGERQLIPSGFFSR